MFSIGDTAALLSFSVIIMSDDGQELFFKEKFHMSKQWSEDSPISYFLLWFLLYDIVFYDY